MNKLWKRRILAVIQGAIVTILVLGTITLLILSCTRNPTKTNRSLAAEPVPTLVGAPGCSLVETLTDGTLSVRCEEKRDFRHTIDLQIRDSDGNVLESKTYETGLASETVTPTIPVSITVDTDGLTAVGGLYARSRWVRIPDFGVIGNMTCGGSDQKDVDGFVLCCSPYLYYFPSIIAVVE